MAVAGCPDYFLHHPNYQQDNVDRTANHRPANLIGSSFQQAASRNSPNHQEDDVDLEALVNDMNSSFESLYPMGSVQCESVPLLHNGQHTHAHTHTQPISPHQRLRRSQPMHILAVRRLQEEAQQFQTSSLPAIPNPFPELCSPASSPTACPGSLPSCQTSEKHVSSVLEYRVRGFLWKLYKETVAGPEGDAPLHCRQRYIRK
ncbi:growth factor receptor-bound protein 10 isoform X1 [Tachysurus ichikawai]